VSESKTTKDPVPSPELEAGLARIRQNIDEVDAVLVKLLNQRARWALEIGELKKREGVPVYQPEREAEVMDHVNRVNRGPLPRAAMQRLFERVVDESRRLERIGGEEER
jgi:chorismate mutase